MRTERKDYTIELDEGLALYDRSSTNAAKRMEKLGLDVLDDRPLDPNNEYFDGRLPPNVNDLTASELGELYGLMDRYCNWLTGYETVAKAEVANRSEQLKLVRARIRKTKSGTQADKDDDTTCDVRFVEANAKWLEATEYFSLLNGLTEASRRDMKVISRLVETKKIEFEQGRRAGNVERGRRDGFSR
jgi:hypothetical protein